MKACGLDIGYGYTKAVVTGKRVIFPSLAGSPDRAAFALSESDSTIVTLGNQTFMVGMEAVERSQFSYRFENRQWYTTPAYMAFAVAAWARLGLSGDVKLVTGLPLSYYEDKKALQARFEGVHRVQSDNYDVEVCIEGVRVVPQPFGAIFLKAFLPTGEFADPNFLSKKIGVIDVGSNHTNILTALNASDIPGQSTAIDMAVWDLVRAIKNHLRTLAPEAELRDHIVAEALKEGTFSYFGKNFDLKPIIEKPRQRLVEQICSTTTQMWGAGADLYAIVISGGGASLVGDDVAAFFSRHQRVIVIKDQYTNANGFYRFAKFLCKG